MDLHLGDVVLIEVHFHQTHGAEIRPAVVVLDSGDEDSVTAPMASRVRIAELDVNLPAGRLPVLMYRLLPGLPKSRSWTSAEFLANCRQTTSPPFALRCARRCPGVE